MNKFILFFIFGILIPFTTALNATACQDITKTIGDANAAIIDVDKAFACIGSFAMTNESKYELINGFATAIEAYAFTDILKSPPQPYPGDTDPYYPAVDLHAELKTLNETSHDNFYDFYSDLYQVITKARDGHFYFTIKDSGNYQYKALAHMQYMLPFNFKINGTDFYAVPHSDTQNFSGEEKKDVEDNQI